MRGDAIKLVIVAGMIGFAVLYGMELSSSGIHRVYGPMDQARDTARQTTQSPAPDEESWTLPPRKGGTGTRAPQTQYPNAAVPRNDHKPLVDRVSAAAAETLHSISSGGIRLVVSLFDKVTGS